MPRGRPPIGDHAMTAAERMRRMRARRAALRKSEPPTAAPGAEEAPFAMVQRAWARANEVEKAEIRAWVWSDCTISSEAPAIRNEPPLRKEPPAAPAPARQPPAVILEELKAETRHRRQDRAEIARLAGELEAALPSTLQRRLEAEIADIKQEGSHAGPPGPLAKRLIRTRVRAIERALDAGDAAQREGRAMTALPPARRQILEFVAAAGERGVMELQIVASGGRSGSMLQSLLREGYVERVVAPDYARLDEGRVRVTDAGRAALAPGTPRRLRR
jgi:hypothetical protein